MVTIVFCVNEKNSVKIHKLANYTIVAKNQIKIDLCVWQLRLIFENKSKSYLGNAIPKPSLKAESDGGFVRILPRVCRILCDSLDQGCTNPGN
jgi:hypothetical protein